ETLKMLAVRAHEKGLELQADIAPEVPDALVGDAGRLRQVLINLVGNATKFTQHGEIVVHIYVAEARDTQGCLHVAGRDTGIGISADQQQHIFDAFMQADASTTRQFGGTGLGLAISSRLVDLMGGRLWVESTVDSGSTFHFTMRCGRRAGAGPA